MVKEPLSGRGSRVGGDLGSQSPPETRYLIIVSCNVGSCSKGRLAYLLSHSLLLSLSALDNSIYVLASSYARLAIPCSSPAVASPFLTLVAFIFCSSLSILTFNSAKSKSIIMSKWRLKRNQPLLREIFKEKLWRSKVEQLNHYGSRV